MKQFLIFVLLMITWVFDFETLFPSKSPCPEFTEFHSSIDTYLVNILTNSEKEIVNLVACVVEEKHSQ